MLFVYLFAINVSASDQPELKLTLDKVTESDDQADEASSGKEQVVADNYGSDYTVKIYVTVRQPHFPGGNVSLTFYINDTEVDYLKYDFGYLYYGSTRTLEYTGYWGPNRTIVIKVVRHAESESDYTMVDTAHTEPLREPYLVDAQVVSDSVRFVEGAIAGEGEMVVYNPSDKFINMTWKKRIV